MQPKRRPFAAQKATFCKPVCKALIANVLRFVKRNASTGIAGGGVLYAFRPVEGARLLFLDDVASGLDGFHVQRNKSVVAFGQSLVKCFFNTVVAHYGAYVEQSAQHNHVEHL